MQGHTIVWIGSASLEKLRGLLSLSNADEPGFQAPNKLVMGLYSLGLHPCSERVASWYIMAFPFSQGNFYLVKKG